MTKRVLNVGGNSKAIALPKHFEGWEHVLLDIDPTGAPDLVCDACELDSLEANQFDAIYCSHNLEHYYRHDMVKVLRGFVHVLNAKGFAHIRVPDMHAVFQSIVTKQLDIEDVLYTAPAGPIHVYDVIYGWQQQIAKSGEEFYAHKHGFSEKSMLKHLRANGFSWVAQGTGNLELVSFAFPQQPDREYFESLDLPFQMS